MVTIDKIKEISLDVNYHYDIIKQKREELMPLLLEYCNEYYVGKAAEDKYDMIDLITSVDKITYQHEYDVFIMHVDVITYAKNGADSGYVRSYYGPKMFYIEYDGSWLENHNGKLKENTEKIQIWNKN